MAEKARAGLFYLLEGRKDGTFAKAAPVKGSDDKPLEIPADENEGFVKKICTHPFACDWDGDGDLDLLTGNFEGTFYLFRNDGSKAKASYAPKPAPVMSGEAPLKVEQAHSAPCVVDWDGDGDLDLVTGSAEGGVFWAENSAKNGEPKLGKFRELVAPAGYGGEDGIAPIESDADIKPSAGTRAWVADVNRDGKLDLLMGDNSTLVYRKDGVSKEEFPKRYKEWSEELAEAQKALRNEDNYEKFRKAYESREDFMREDSTGFVWLYLRK